jgi:hypothetical protein
LWGPRDEVSDAAGGRRTNFVRTLRFLADRALFLAAAAAFAGCAGAAHPGPTAGSGIAAVGLGTEGVARHKAGRSRQIGTPSGFSGMRVTFAHSLLSDNGILIANYAALYGISTIYVPVTGEDISALVNANPTAVSNLQAMLAVATVYFVDGNTSWLTTPSVLPPDVASLASIATMYPQVAGILYEFNPEQAATWSTQRQTLIANYFTLIGTIQSSPSAASFSTTLFAAQPNFATYKVGIGRGAPTMLEQLQTVPGYGGCVLSVHGNSESAQLATLTNALPQLIKPFTIEASTAPPAGGSTYYGQSASYLSTNLTQLAQDVGAQNSALTGVEVNGWSDQYNSLQSILPQPPVFTGNLAAGPLVPPAGSIYLGAYVDPAGPPGPTPAQTAAFETQIGRTLAYNIHFYGWPAAWPGPNEADDVAHGRIPVISWNCGDTNARVAAGDDDAVIIARANAVKAFGSPVMIRWFWEMNLSDANNAPRTQCWDPVNDFPGGLFAPGPFISAWNHIRAVFASQGVTNAVWLWCVANAHGGQAQYYPGDGAVDWVGMDDYDTTNVSMQSTFFNLSEQLSQFQEKPLMITETGALAANQVPFLTGADSVLQTNFPWVRGIGYLDSVGSFQTWTLTTDGLSAFSTFAQSPYMSAMESSAPIL